MPKTTIMAALGNAKTRTFVIVGGVLVLIILIYTFMQLGGEEESTAEPSRTVAVPSSIRAIPGNVTPERYAELQRQENLQRAEEAERKKGVAIPTIIGQVTDQIGENGTAGTFGPGGAFGAGGQLGPNGQPLPPGYYYGPDGQLYGPDGQVVDPTTLFGGVAGGAAGFAGADQAGIFGQARPVGQKSEEELRDERLQKQRDELEARRKERERQKELERLRKLAELEKQKHQQSIQQAAQAMEAHAQSLAADWKSITPQIFVQGSLTDEDLKSKENGNGSNGKNSNAIQVTPPEKDRDGLIIVKEKHKEIIKAGSVLFGVMDTSINTDEPGPVLATVVAGKYKGAKIIGSIEHPDYAEKVIVSFQTMNLPSKEKSVSINAVAIDPDTARTALASDVDHHYLLRYGSLFAAAFMQGYGKAITNAGTTTTSPNGTTQETKPDLSGSEQLFAALGKVGEEWGNAVKPFFDTPYTVSVDQGVGVGLLFLSDVDVTPTEG